MDRYAAAMKHTRVTAFAATGRVTVRDVAAATGVSVATVSRVLTGKGPVAPQTRQLVRDAMDQLGSRAPVPRQPSAPRTAQTVLVRCPYVLTDYFGIIVSSIAETLAVHRRPILLDAGEAVVDADTVHLLPKRTDLAGAVLILPPEPTAELERLVEHKFPFVVVDPRTPPPPDTLAVSAANFAGARALTRHLASLGHRRIGVISGMPNWLTSDARLAGHVAALAEAGTLPDRSLVRHGEPNLETGLRAARELLDLDRPPTAILGFNDKVAVGVMQVAASRGLRVPRDLSVAGFDDLELAKATTPPLTTVRQPLQELGRMAVSLLMRVLDQHEVEALHVELATQLVVRDSTGPVRPRT
jgi:LacI family transcriptional regulator